MQYLVYLGYLIVTTIIWWCLGGAADLSCSSLKWSSLSTVMAAWAFGGVLYAFYTQYTQLKIVKEDLDLTKKQFQLASETYERESLKMWLDHNKPTYQSHKTHLVSPTVDTARKQVSEKYINYYDERKKRYSELMERVGQIS